MFSVLSNTLTYYYRKVTNLQLPSFTDEELLRKVDFDKDSALSLKHYIERRYNSPRADLLSEMIHSESARLKAYKQRVTLDSLEQDIRDLINCDWDEIQIEADPYERLMQYADSCCPIYTYDLLSIAQSELWLATEEPEWECVGAIATIQANIIQHLLAVAHRHVELKMNY